MRRPKRKTIAAALCLLLCLCLLPAGARAEGLPDALTAEKSLCRMAGCPEGRLLEDTSFMPAGESGSDWMAFVFALNGVPERYGSYLARLEKNVTMRYERHGCLDPTLATEYHRIALTVLALGGDPRAFGKDGAGKPVDLVAEGIWDFRPGVGRQGLNGLIYALILLDAGDYAVPEGSGTDREWLLEQILGSQNGDGGFGFSPGDSDVDMTAMTLSALAPYADSCRESVDRALEWLSGRQGPDGQFASFGSENAEAAAQVVLALSTLGLDPAEDPRFTKNGVSAADALASFRLEDGTFCHVAGEPSDGMATEQALMALTAMQRMRSGGASIYDFTDYVPPAGVRKGTPPAVWAGIAAAAVCAGAGAAVLAGRRRKRHADSDE